MTAELQTSRKWHLIIAAAIFGGLWCVFTMRWLSLVFLIPALVSLWSMHYHRRKILVSTLWIAFALSPLCPFGFSLQHLPGPPRFVPLDGIGRI
jgi:hypothetical protein